MRDSDGLRESLKTQRDAFAQAALTGLLASQGSIEKSSYGAYAQQTWEIADAMMSVKTRREAAEQVRAEAALQLLRSDGQPN